MRAVDRVAETLRDAMLDGSLAPGDHLAEADLAARLGVSRTPVREALGRLAAEGLVDLQPNRGARVVNWTAEELRQIFELRMQLEPHVARLATSAVTAEQLRELHELAEEMHRIGSPGPQQDLAAVVGLNRRFHDLLVEAAHQPALAAALSTAIHAGVVRRNFESYDAGSMARSLGHHREIVQALRAGDADWAEAVMRSHLCNARVALLAAPDPTTEEDQPR